ncbi:MAG: hypothetical protein CMH60_04955 [Myxococcales bacterium]|nr:hypothetical protein [Myxococcales bacterium]
MLLCIVASIHLSTAELSFGTQVYGSNKVVAGQQAAFRLMIVNTANLRSLAFDHAEVKLKDKKDILFKRAFKYQEIANIHVPIPKTSSAELTLEFYIETDGNSDEFSIPLKVRSEPGPIESALIKSPFTKSKKIKGTTIEVRLYPDTGKIVSAFKNHLRLYMTKDGQPLATKIEIKPLGREITTNEDGFAHFAYKPMAHLKELTFVYTLENMPLTLKIPIHVEALQMQVDFKKSRFVRPGDTQAITIEKLPFSSPLHLDLWLGDTLVQAASYEQPRGPIELNIEVPDWAGQPLRWQFFRNLMAPQGTDLNYTQWLSHSSGEEGAEQSQAFLNKVPGAETITLPPTVPERHQTFLSRLQPYHSGTPLLHSSVSGRQADLDAWRTNLRQIVHRIFMLCAILGALLLVISLWRHHRRTQIQMKSALDEGFLAGEAVDPRLTHNYPKDRKVDLLMALVAIFSLIYAIYILLTHIQWRY